MAAVGTVAVAEEVTLAAVAAASMVVVSAAADITADMRAVVLTADIMEAVVAPMAAEARTADAVVMADAVAMDHRCVGLPALRIAGMRIPMVVPRVAGRQEAIRPSLTDSSIRSVALTRSPVLMARQLRRMQPGSLRSITLISGVAASELGVEALGRGAAASDGGAAGAGADGVLAGDGAGVVGVWV
jgi:hypothetical protein